MSKANDRGPLDWLVELAGASAPAAAAAFAALKLAPINGWPAVARFDRFGTMFAGTNRDAQSASRRTSGPAAIRAPILRMRSMPTMESSKTSCYSTFLTWHHANCCSISGWWSRSSLRRWRNCCSRIHCPKRPRNRASCNCLRVGECRPLGSFSSV